MIDEAGQNVGVLPLEKALEMAREKGLDLIEIAPTASPPVARIMSFDKFRYQKEKELRKQRQAQKILEMKHIRISPRAARNDLGVKLKKLEEFMNDGHMIEIQLILRGREKGNKDWARHKLNEFLAMITTPYEITLEPRFAGRGMVTQLRRKS